MRIGGRDDSDVPIWAREDAFPSSPYGWGWLDNKGGLHPCDSKESLISAIGNDHNADMALAWTPGRRHMMLPEEVEGSTAALHAARERRATDDFIAARRRLDWYGIVLGGLTLVLCVQGWHASAYETSITGRFISALHTVRNSMPLGVALLFFLIFAFIPWYQARKRLADLGKWNDGELASMIQLLRFEMWLDFQKAPITRLLLYLIGLVGLAQLAPGNSIVAAGLMKQAYLHGEWWRLLTAPLLHGNLIHFLMNSAALLYLGKRVEIFARWPHVPLVFLLSACIGGEASARFAQAPSVGASGGLMGLLGFLLVFESLHDRLVPRKARRRLVAGVLLTGLIGLIGYRFIDNAAHAGGLVAGMIYAAIVFPKSSSPSRPCSTLPDRIAGAAAISVLAFSTILAIWKIAGN